MHTQALVYLYPFFRVRDEPEEITEKESHLKR